MFKRIVTAVAALAAVLAPGIGAAGAAGAHVRPQTALPFYLEDDSSGHTVTECMSPHGAGNQVTIASGACSSVTWTEANSNGLPVGCNSGDSGASYQDASGNYLAPGANHILTVSGTQFFWCVSFNTDFFLLLRNPGTSDYAGTNGETSGTGVVVNSSPANTGWSGNPV
jgi:hypothetical protein